MKSTENKSRNNKTVMLVVSVIVLVGLIVGIAFGIKSKKDELSKQNPSENVGESTATDSLSGKHHVEMNIKGYGKIALELDADESPLTVTNFVNLCNDGFYNGLTFHRFVDGFVLQGGDPDGNGTGGSEKEIKGEFSSNGVNNTISHTRGVISMARSSDPDSASSQFFICLSDNYTHVLDGEYAAFGKVTQGMDVIDKVCADLTESDRIPTDKQPVIESAIVVD